MPCVDPHDSRLPTWEAMPNPKVVPYTSRLRRVRHPVRANIHRHWCAHITHPTLKSIKRRRRAVEGTQEMENVAQELVQRIHVNLGIGTAWTATVAFCELISHLLAFGSAPTSIPAHYVDNERHAGVDECSFGVWMCERYFGEIKTKTGSKVRGGKVIYERELQNSITTLF